MTEIEQKALALVNEVTFGDEPWTLDDVRGGFVFKALCRAIEQHEAFKREVSDAVHLAIDRCGHDGLRAGHINEYLGRFILPKPKPDPLVEAVNEAFPHVNVEFLTDRLRKAIEARGLKIVEAE